MASAVHIFRMLCALHFWFDLSTCVLTKAMIPELLLTLVLELWLQRWARANEQHPNENVGYWLGGYAALGVLSLVATFLANWYCQLNFLHCWANCD